MRKLMMYGLVMMLVFSCKEQSDRAIADTSEFDISTENWPPRTKPSAKVVEVLKDWSEYTDFNKTFDGLYTAANTEDLNLIIEDLVDQQNLLAESIYPELYNTPQIKSRQIVLKTCILKVKGDLEYRFSPEKSVIEMIHAYNTFHKQFEILSTNTLDIKKLLEEETTVPF